MLIKLKTNIFPFKSLFVEQFENEFRIVFNDTLGVFARFKDFEEAKKEVKNITLCLKNKEIIYEVKEGI